MEGLGLRVEGLGLGFGADIMLEKGFGLRS